MKRRLKVILIAIVALLSTLYLLNQAESPPQADTARSYKELVYTKHARCRMDCREINEQEIREIIRDGKLNQQKSGYDKKHKNETYAFEGYSYQRQHIRVVVTPQKEDLLVITVIDLDKDWVCNCN